jgi:hypothetical protein
MPQKLMEVMKGRECHVIRVDWVKRREVPAPSRVPERVQQTDIPEVTARAPDEKKKTRLLCMCHRLVK